MKKVLLVLGTLFLLTGCANNENENEMIPNVGSHFVYETTAFTDKGNAWKEEVVYGFKKGNYTQVFFFKEGETTPSRYDVFYDDGQLYQQTYSSINFNGFSENVNVSVNALEQPSILKEVKNEEPSVSFSYPLTSGEVWTDSHGDQNEVIKTNETITTKAGEFSNVSVIKITLPAFLENQSYILLYYKEGYGPLVIEHFDKKNVMTLRTELAEIKK